MMPSAKLRQTYAWILGKVDMKPSQGDVWILNAVEGML